jgi:hypothetical protein
LTHIRQWDFGDAHTALVEVHRAQRAQKNRCPKLSKYKRIEGETNKKEREHKPRSQTSRLKKNGAGLKLNHNLEKFLFLTVQLLFI